MGRVLPRFLFCLLAAGFWGRLPAAAQAASQSEEVDPKTTTRVTLGSTSGTPGTSVVVPIYFTPAEGSEVGRLQLQINFVSANLKFDKLETGIAAELGNVDLDSEIQEEKNDQDVPVSTLTVNASFLTPEPPAKGIPQGLLGYITFRISETGRPATISLRTQAEANELKTNQPVAELRSFDATVEVLAPGTQPAVACFLFSH